jgi:hypothetical protein
MRYEMPRKKFEKVFDISEEGCIVVSVRPAEREHRRAALLGAPPTSGEVRKPSEQKQRPAHRVRHSPARD